MTHMSTRSVPLPKIAVRGKKYVYRFQSQLFDQRFDHLTIHPTDVIKGWVLCHHLGWVIRSIAFASCYDPFFKQPSLEQTRLRLVYLEHAEDCLIKELIRLPKCTLIPMEPYSLTTKQVIRDWKLSFHLGESIFYLKTSLSSYRRKEALERALKHLREEIRISKKQANCMSKQQISKSKPFFNTKECIHG